MKPAIASLFALGTTFCLMGTKTRHEVPTFGTSFAYEQMRKQKSGHIVNIASAAGLLGLPASIPYATTKAAMIAFSNDFRVEAATFGVDVTVVCPGFIESNIFQNADVGALDGEKARAAISVKFLSVSIAVNKILQGVGYKKGLFMFPQYVSALWLFRRVAPRLYERFIAKPSLLEARKARTLP